MYRLKRSQRGPHACAPAALLRLAAQAAPVGDPTLNRPVTDARVVGSNQPGPAPLRDARADAERMAAVLTQESPAIGGSFFTVPLSTGLPDAAACAVVRGQPAFRPR